MTTIADVGNTVIDFAKTQAVEYDTTVGGVDYDIKRFVCAVNQVNIVLAMRPTQTELQLPLSITRAKLVIQNMLQHSMSDTNDDIHIAL